MTVQTISLKEYAAALLGPGPDGTADSVKDHKIQWLTKRLRGEAKPHLPGNKAGRQWRATEDDVEKAIELLRPPSAGVPRVPSTSSMTPTSRRRLGLL
ncbi:hypothetical protein [Mycolicibacterium tokaiense]|uniref:Uncharacterized protein n=1 Tax=Mycolicibacterium tokaiense TaxID=39695 RepID=A0A378TAX7_9MYCO|nr:hypothetical protein [Mycolicibacterium tokaiense]BBY88464.1 hypothetical protein MTOK_42460 [Mycolicibacterium tokaiense]STZ57013.1 Uncharacterised protein [Mycolicibacterium tokaiense]